MPKRPNEKKSKNRPHEVDPEHDFTYGGDMQHDDPDESHEDATKGGRPGKGNRPPDERDRSEEEV